MIRLSGVDVLEKVRPFFSGRQPVTQQASHTVQLGSIRVAEQTLDQVLLSVFRAPHSYTGEDVVEISCHGSLYIQREILQLFLKNGVRMADPGEFTLRAFLNGKMDLSQAEAVADLIASRSAAAHQIAMRQMRGGVSHAIQDLRQSLIRFASLLELELDFGQEDVTFADRKALEVLLEEVQSQVARLLDSFALGNVLKNGIPIVLIGEPNVGKSTLLNALLDEERAIVSHIAGTTRDTLEEELMLEGVACRFIDTAGLRETEDEIERIGIERTHAKIRQAQIVLLLLDATRPIPPQRRAVAALGEVLAGKSVIQLINKSDLQPDEAQAHCRNPSYPTLALSAKTRAGLAQLKARLSAQIQTLAPTSGGILVSNARHYAALQSAALSLKRAQEALQTGISSDLLAEDVRQALFHLGEITGEVTPDELLGELFTKFCIGK